MLTIGIFTATAPSLDALNEHLTQIGDGSVTHRANREQRTGDSERHPEAWSAPNCAGKKGGAGNAKSYALSRFPRTDMGPNFHDVEGVVRVHVHYLEGSMRIELVSRRAQQGAERPNKGCNSSATPTTPEQRGEALQGVMETTTLPPPVCTQGDPKPLIGTVRPPAEASRKRPSLGSNHRQAAVEGQRHAASAIAPAQRRGGSQAIREYVRQPPSLSSHFPSIPSSVQKVPPKSSTRSRHSGGAGGQLHFAVAPEPTQVFPPAQVSTACRLTQPDTSAVQRSTAVDDVQTKFDSAALAQG
jgi:hypothetical protein